MITLQANVERLATAYRSSCILFGAIELGLLEEIINQKGPVAITDLAGTLNLDPHKVQTLVHCLIQMELLKQAKNGKVELILKEGDLPGHSFGQGVLNYKHEFEEWINLAEQVKAPPVQSREDEVFNSEQITAYLEMVKLSNFDRAKEVADLLTREIGPIDTVLDIGGGHGLYTQRLLEQNSKACACILDLPAAIGYAESTLNEQVKSRTKLIKNDARAHNTREDFDLTMINDLLHSFSAEEKFLIIQNGVRATKLGGWICIGKYQMDADHPENQDNNLFFSLKMILNSKNGYLESNQEVIEMLEKCGVGSISIKIIKSSIPSVVILGRVEERK